MKNLVGKRVRFQHWIYKNTIEGTVDGFKDNHGTNMAIVKTQDGKTYLVTLDRLEVFVDGNNHLLYVCPKCKTCHEGDKWNQATINDNHCQTIVPIETGIQNPQPTLWYACPSCEVRVFASSLRLLDISVKIKDLQKLVLLVNGTADEDDMQVVLSILMAYPSMPIEDVLEVFYNGDYMHMVAGNNWDELVDDYIFENFGNIEADLYDLIDRKEVIAKMKADFIETPFGLVKLDEVI